MDAREAGIPFLRAKGRTTEMLLAPGSETASGKDLVVTQNDIRAIQLAKGALYAGAKLLMEEMGVQTLDRVRLAGAFGSYIDPEYAMMIGMIPDCDLDHVEGIGNAAGDGARIALLNMQQRDLAERAAGEVYYVETAMNAEFQEQFVAAMALPHASDPFPHLKGIIPPKRRDEERRRDRRGRRRGGGHKADDIEAGEGSV
jgi:uncharacterized 2Fe-2S/4Fe-4S cluster protein (DUF4445 family)